MRASSTKCEKELDTRLGVKEEEKTSLSGMLKKTEVKTPTVKKITKDMM